MQTSEELTFYWKLVTNVFSWKYDLMRLPGPSGYFGVGNIPNIMRPDYHVQMLDWANQYGGLYRFCLAHQYIVVVTDPALVAQILGRGEGSAPRKCVAYQFFDLATNHLGSHSFFTTSDEQQWAAMRKAAAPAFSAANVKRAFPSAFRHALAVSDKFADAGPSNPVECQHNLEILMLNVFVEALWGIEPTSFPGEDVAAAMNLVLEEANERLKVPLRQLYYSWVHPQAEQAVRKAQCFLGEVYGGMADSLREQDQSGQISQDDTNLAACLSRLKCPTTGKPYTREQLIPEIGALMMAGFDTSSHSVAWALFTIASLPHIQKEIHQELDEAGLLGKAGRPLQYEDLFRLTYLNAVIDESMRMYPVASTASVRELTKTTTVGKYKLPAGVLVWPMLYALHNSKHNWQSPGPEVFEPKRWLKPTLADPTQFSPYTSPCKPSPTSGHDPAPAAAAAAGVAETGSTVTFADQQPTNSVATSLPHQVTGSSSFANKGLVKLNTTALDQHKLESHLNSLQPHQLAARQSISPSSGDSDGIQTVEVSPGDAKSLDDSPVKVAEVGKSGSAEVEQTVEAISSHPYITTPNGTCYSYNASGPSSLGSNDDAWTREFGSSSSGTAGGNADTIKPAPVVVAAQHTKSARRSSQSGADGSSSFPSITNTQQLDFLSGVKSRIAIAQRKLFPSTSTSTSTPHTAAAVRDASAGSSPPGRAPASSGAVASASARSGVVGVRPTRASTATALSEEGVGGSKSVAAAGGGRAPKNFLPFSDGPKSCLGQALGLMEVRTVLATLLSHYNFSLDPSMGGPKAVHASMIMSLTLKIKGGLRLLGTPLE